VSAGVRSSAIFLVVGGLGGEGDGRYGRNVFRAVVKGEDGYDVTLKSGVEAFCDSMEEAVPGCRASVHRLFELVPKIGEALAYITRKKGKPNGLVMMTRHAEFMKVAAHSVEDVMKALDVPEKARNIINTYWGYLGVPTDELNCMHFLNMLNSYVVDGAAMPHLRSHELSSSLCKVILDAGGEIWYNSEVTEFLYREDGSVGGVVSGGKRLSAGEVISNIMPHAVFNMSDQARIPATDLKLANAREFGISVATVYLGLDCAMEDLGIEDYTVFVMSDQSPRRQYEDRAKGSLYIVNCLNKVIPDSSPAGTCTMFFTVPIFGSDLPSDLKPEEYKRYKNDLAAKYIEDYERLMGIDIRSHIEEIVVATPVTFARYLGTPEGSIYGYKLSGWDNILTRISREKEEYTIKGLSFCGGHAVRGDGYSSAYVTGDAVGRRVAKRMKGGN